MESYVGDIRAFLQWLESKGNIFTGNLKRFHITSYKSYLVQEGYEINIVNKKINSLQSLNQLLIDKKYLTEQVGYKNVAHKFRHKFCTRLLRRGVELTSVAKLAAHSSIQTKASFYINTSQKDKREAVELLKMLQLRLLLTLKYQHHWRCKMKITIMSIVLKNMV